MTVFVCYLLGDNISAAGHGLQGIVQGMRPCTVALATLEVFGQNGKLLVLQSLYLSISGRVIAIRGLLRTKLVDFKLNLLSFAVLFALLANAVQ